MILAPRAVMLLICMPIVGRLYRHLDARVLVVFGILVTCWSYYDLARLSLAAGFWNLVPTLLIMGVGMPFMFVTLTTLSLSTIPRADMTDASSLCTLARRIGGNIGYALVATLVAHVSSYNPNLADFQRQVATLLDNAGLNPAAVQHAGQALINLLVNRQASMMAYNDVSWVLGLLFMATIPLALILPSRRSIARQQQAHGQ